MYMCHTGLTENQNRLLYLVSLYTHKAESHDDKDEWIRKPALLVLIYEGVVANVLDYDYAPASELIENRRIYLNISQEGKSDVEFLREEELLNGLQIATKGFKPMTCYQISEKGLELVKRISQKEKEATHEFVYAKGTRELLSVRSRRPAVLRCLHAIDATRVHQTRRVERPRCSAQARSKRTSGIRTSSRRPCRPICCI